MLLAILILASLGVQPMPLAAPEIHLIPEGYRGWTQIVFQDASGVPARREGQAHLYELPPDGVLSTSAAPNHGRSPAFQFFYVSATGVRTALRINSPSTAPRDTGPDAKPEIWFLRQGRFQAKMPAECDVPTYGYFVGTGAEAAAADESAFAHRLFEFVRDRYACPK